MPSNHEPQYIVFMSVINEKTASIEVDVAFTDEQARPPRTPVFIEISIPSRTKADSEDELLPMADLEDFELLDEPLIDAVIEACDGVHIASMICDNRRYWMFYGKTTTGTDLAAQRALDGCKFSPPFPKAQQRVKQDPQWSVYDSLVPTPEQARIASDMAQMPEFADDQEALDAPRDIHHLAFLPDAATLATFTAWCDDNGYKVLDQSITDGEFPDMLGIEFSHQGPLNPDDLCPRTMEILTQTLMLDGAYPGWDLDQHPFADLDS